MHVEFEPVADYEGGYRVTVVAERYVRGLTPLADQVAVAVAAEVFLGPSVSRSANQLVTQAGIGR